MFNCFFFTLGNIIYYVRREIKVVVQSRINYPYAHYGYENTPGFLPTSVWKVGQQSIGVVGDLVVKTLDRENSFSHLMGRKCFCSTQNQIKLN